MYPPHLFICFFDEWPFCGDKIGSKSFTILCSFCDKTLVLKTSNHFITKLYH